MSSLSILFSDLRRIVGASREKNNLLKKYGKGVHISWDTEINNTTFDQYAFIAHHAQILNSVIGKHTSIGRYSKIRNSKIGKYCSISWDVTIGAVTHPMKSITTAAITYRKEYHLIENDLNFPQKTTLIGNDVWIGCNVIILSGVSIGDGAIIGAGAIVTKNVPPYAIMTGCPARIIRYRFDEKMIGRVQNLKWWDWKVEDQRACIHLFSKDLTIETLSEFEKYIGITGIEE